MSGLRAVCGGGSEGITARSRNADKLAEGCYCDAFGDILKETGLVAASLKGDLRHKTGPKSEFWITLPVKYGQILKVDNVRAVFGIAFGKYGHPPGNLSAGFHNELFNCPQ